MNHPEFEVALDQRHRAARLWLLLFQSFTLVGIIALTVLLISVLNSAFGYVAVENRVDPMALAIDGIPLERLTKADLLQILLDNVSHGLVRRYENDIPFALRSRENVLDLVLERVIQPEIVEQWSLYQSIFQRNQVFNEAANNFPGVQLRFESWLDAKFITSPQSGRAENAGVRTAILGSLWTISIAILFAFPIGVGAAIYLQEYTNDTWINRIIQTNINNLAGVPSIIYGILGLSIFVRTLEYITSGAFLSNFDAAAANGRTIFSAGLTLGLLILPLIIINAQEAIKAVPNSLRHAGLGLGATRWQTIWAHVLPSALPGIMTGTILSISRAIGETAPMVVIGASTFITVDPDGPFSKFTTLPIQIFQWTSRPQEIFGNIAAAAIVVLLVMLLSLNFTAILLRNRYSRRP
jgi:phosphate transport system permease protein